MSLQMKENATQRTAFAFGRVHAIGECVNELPVKLLKV
jgi:hypothetical protein